MLSEFIVFGLYDGNGTPKDDATPTFIDYRDRAGLALVEPDLLNLGAGLYGFVPSPEDRETGVVFLIDSDSDSGTSPGRIAGVVSFDALPFVGWHLEDQAGALWTGAAPTVGAYKKTTGDDAVAPTVNVVRPYLFTLTPSAADLLEGRAFRIDAPASATPKSLAGGWSTINQGSLLALSSGSAGEYRMKTGDTRAMPVQLYADQSGKPLDLQAATVLFTMATRAGVVLVNSQPCSIVDEAEGRVEYQWAAGQTAAAGFHYGEFRVTFPDGTVQRCPSSWFLSVVIAAAL